MIRFVHVSKIYPGNSRALTDINVDIDKGEFVFLTGPSGAGKTTLLKLLFRDEEPTEGQVVVNGQSLGSLNGRGVARLRREIGLVFQEFRLLPRLSALENVALAAEVIGVSKKASRAKAAQLLRELGLSDRHHAKPLTLSAGEQRRVAIARALINDPTLILADEPTGNLDAELAEETMRLFARIRERGATIILASHQLDFIKRYGTRIVSLRRGAVVDDLERVVKKEAAP